MRVDKWLAGFLLGICAFSVPAAWVPVTITELYLDPEAESAIRFKAEDGIGELSPNYVIRDYFDRKIGAGVLRERNGVFETTLKLKQGFYELDFGTQRAGIVVLPRHTGKTDPFFGIETLLYNQPEKIIRSEMDILNRSGIGIIREFQNWSHQEPEPGRWDLRTEEIYPIAAEKGIGITTFLSVAPAWTGANTKKGTIEYIPYPRDLTKLEPSLPVMLKRRAPALKNFQIENEPDLKKIPGDSYLPLLAACSWILQKNKIELPVVIAAYSSYHMAEDMFQPYFAGGILDYGDIFAFHTYTQPEKLMELIRFYRGRMAGHAKAAMPIWITESGKPWSRGIENPQASYGGPNGKLRALPDEDMLSARWITMKGIEAKAGGVACYFPFAMRFFREGVNNFAMMDFYWTPHRSMATYLFSIQALSGKEYVGDWQACPKEIAISRVFSDGKRSMLVLYAADDAEQSVNLSGLPFEALYAADGSALAADSGGNVRFSGGLLYAEAAADRFRGQINADTDAMKMLNLSRGDKPVPRKSNAVIYQFAYWNETQRDAVRYFSAPNRLEFQLFNLDDKPRTTEPVLILPSGGKVLSVDLTGKIILEPNSFRTLTYQLDMSGVLTPERTIVLRDKMDVGNPLLLQFLDPNTVNTRTYGLNLASRWKANSSGEMTIREDAEESAIHFHVEWKTDVKHWVYPEYVLGPTESLDGLQAISFEIKARQDKGNQHYHHAGVQLADNENRWSMTRFDSPGEQWETRTITLPQDCRPGIDRIRIGMGPAGNSLDYFVRNIRLYFKPIK